MKTINVVILLLLLNGCGHAPRSISDVQTVVLNQMKFDSTTLAQATALLGLPDEQRDLSPTVRLYLYRVKEGGSVGICFQYWTPPPPAPQVIDFYLRCMSG